MDRWPHGRACGRFKTPDWRPQALFAHAREGGTNCLWASSYSLLWFHTFTTWKTEASLIFSLYFTYILCLLVHEIKIEGFACLTDPQFTLMIHLIKPDVLTLVAASHPGTQLTCSVSTVLHIFLQCGCRSWSYHWSVSWQEKAESLLLKKHVTYCMFGNLYWAELASVRLVSRASLFTGSHVRQVNTRTASGHLGNDAHTRTIFFFFICNGIMNRCLRLKVTRKLETCMNIIKLIKSYSEKWLFSF